MVTAPLANCLVSDGNELREGSCKPIIFIFARASTEPGLLVSNMNPFTYQTLEILTRIQGYLHWSCCVQ